MKIKNLFNVFAIILIITFVSCQTVEKKDRRNDNLIAQANISAKEEKIPTINEVISYDIAFTKLKEVVQSAEYAEKFNSQKPYTVYAPLNGAFKKLPEGELEKLSKEELAAIMNCHIIRGTINEQDIIKAINEGGGSVKLKTLGGTRLIASRKRGKIYLIDKNGNAGRLMKTDIEVTNGMIHTLETVMLPKK